MTIYCHFPPEFRRILGYGVASYGIMKEWIAALREFVVPFGALAIMAFGLYVGMYVIYGLADFYHDLKQKFRKHHPRPQAERSGRISTLGAIWYLVVNVAFWLWIIYGIYSHWR
jgi:hypothetical protein